MFSRTMIRYLVLTAVSFLFAACGGGGDNGGPVEIPITNQTLLSMLTDGEPSQGYTGISTHIDTKVPIAGLPMIPGDLILDPATVALINKNAASFLDTTKTPVFDSGSGTVAGVSVDSARQVITVTVAGGTVSWSFAPNRVTRVYDTPPARYSVYAFRTVNGTTVADFDDRVNQGGVNATYAGSASFQRDSTTNGVLKVIAATFHQNRLETMSDGGTVSVFGAVSMGAEDARPNLTFAGTFSIHLPTYGQVSGSVNAAGMSYARGSLTSENYNFRTTSTVIAFSSPTDYSQAATVSNPLWLQGVWSGSYSEGAQQAGTMQFSATGATTLSWWGLPSVSGSSLGTSVTYIDDTTIRFHNGSVLWGTARKVSDTSLTGTWSLGGASGTFSLAKNP